MRFAATTVIRHVPSDASSGRLLFVDIDHQAARIVRQARLSESPFRASDLNPRGGTRGLRAVAVQGDHLIVADCTRVMRLDRSLAVVDELRHPWLGMIHAIVPGDDGVWVVSAAADAAIRLSWDGRVLDVVRPVDLPAIAAGLRLAAAEPLAGREFDDPAGLVAHPHDLTHLNAMAVTDEAIWLSLGRALRASGTGQSDLDAFRSGNWQPPEGAWSVQHAIVRIGIDGHGTAVAADVSWQQPVSELPNHDLRIDAGLIWFNDSSGNDVVAIRDGAECARIPVPGEFLRAMVPYGPGSIVVSSQHPLAVHLVDLVAQRTVATHVISEPDAGDAESITCLCACPEGW